MRFAMMFACGVFFSQLAAGGCGQATPSGSQGGDGGAAGSSDGGGSGPAAMTGGSGGESGVHGSGGGNGQGGAGGQAAGALGHGGGAGASAQAGAGGSLADGGVKADAAGTDTTPRKTPDQFLEIKVMRDLPAFDHDGIVLTFDDGPDAADNTSKVLDTLKTENLKATFCINDHNWGALRETDFLHAVVARIVAEGHGLCNHTDHHWDLTMNIPDQKNAQGVVTIPSHPWTDGEFDAEFMDIVSAVAEFAPLAPALTLTRAPFLNTDIRSITFLQKYGVHLAVDITSGDSPTCQFTGNVNCVINGVMNPVNGGAYGIVLMHSPVPETVMALPTIIQQLRAKGKKFYTVEDVIKAKYGKTSHELYYPSP